MSAALKATTDRLANDLRSFSAEIAAPYLQQVLGVHAADHQADIVDAAVLKDPSLLHTWRKVRDTNADRAGIIGLLRSTLGDLKHADPDLFEPCPSAQAFAATYTAWQMHTPWRAAGAAQRAQAMGEAHRDGVDTRRRTYAQMCRELKARGRGDWVDRTPHSQGARLLGDNDPREAAARMGLSIPGQPTVGPSRTSLPDGRQGQIAGGPRKVVAFVKLVSPDGSLQDVNADVAADYVRLKGFRTPVAAAPAPAAPVDDDDDTPGNSAPLAPKSSDQAQAVSKLGALRDEAQALGLSVDPTWGIVRLQREIASVASPAIAPVDGAPENVETTP